MGTELMLGQNWNLVELPDLSGLKPEIKCRYWMLMKECYVKGITDSFFNVVSVIVTPNKFLKYKNS